MQYAGYVKEALADTPLVFVMGPRQVGKTRILRSRAGSPLFYGHETKRRPVGRRFCFPVLILRQHLFSVFNAIVSSSQNSRCVIDESRALDARFDQVSRQVIGQIRKSCVHHGLVRHQ
jgi:hypothetical protein